MRESGFTEHIILRDSRMRGNDNSFMTILGSATAGRGEDKTQRETFLRSNFLLLTCTIVFLTIESIILLLKL